ncbi:hypothetical protein TheveDRAFT_0813 [Thermanaerovibrio velox DSM 12556]|uniref:Uncharacterized protein n=2 Tax=Thermanaerovibrio TaxID=81461 RepID=H0URM2_9BACT|nr:hypothetical protein TheveDRAFT_0813 [Thermanaerovibrio velox DSM 12556]
MLKWLLPLAMLLSLSIQMVPLGFKLVVRDQRGVEVFSLPIYLGSRLVLRSEHSLERSQMEDQVVICDGKLWIWSTAVRTYNAGIPTEVPVGGVFLRDGEWDVFLGGRRPLPDDFRYRVGNAMFGKNQMFFCGERWDLFKVFPNRVLNFRLEAR